jgi:hypothetical protein
VSTVKVRRCRTQAAIPLACERTVGLTRLRFVWTGGMYIDISREGGPVREVINVWDYEKSEPTISHTLAALERRGMTGYGTTRRTNSPLMRSGIDRRAI